VYFSLTNDGNAILREIDVAHPAAKNMIELSRTQDEECGDGTTSVIVLGIHIHSFIYISDVCVAQLARSLLSRFPSLNATFTQ
jgi:hypothetical protein